MSGGDLFEAVLASPGDDLPRLVYADWLDDHGEDARAEFIRVQVELARGPTPELERRSSQLLDANRARWIIPDLRGVQEFHRGFVDSLRISGEEFTTHAERIGRSSPVTKLRLAVMIDHLAAAASVTWWNQITHLDLTGNVGIGSRMEDFFGTAPMSEMQSLTLRNCQLWPDSIGSLQRLSPTWPKLSELNLSGNPLGDDGITRLASSTIPAKLESFILRCDEQHEIDAIHAGGAAALAAADFRKLKTLDLAGQYLREEGLHTLAMSNKLSSLLCIDLSYNDIVLLTPASLIQFIRNTRLNSVIFDDNQILDSVLEELYRHQEFRSLTRFSHRMNRRDYSVT